MWDRNGLPEERSSRTPGNSRAPAYGASAHRPNDQELAGGRSDVDNGGMVATLDDGEIEQACSRLPGWERAGDQIVKWYELASFRDAITFVDSIADAAEAADHHPDLDIRYRRVRVSLSTHDAGGITQKDIDLAKEIEAAVPPI
jgi:4a-hydroxytetrahydrobiopterin dehydratase